MTLKERYKTILSYFIENQPTAQSELLYKNPFELLVAVILSAQCTDKRVNMVTPKLFDRYSSAFEMSESTVEEIFEYIRTVSYPNSKAQYLKSMSMQLVSSFNGVVPNTVSQLMQLKGVGRKTANVVASICFSVPAIAVDTHVFRVAHRLGLVSKKATTPLLVEQTLVKHIPSSLQAIAHHWLILHGRYTCVARNPKCNLCKIQDYCATYTGLA